MPTIVDSKPSPEFTPISLVSVYNRNGANFSGDELSDETLAGKELSLTGENVIRGIPFHLGRIEGNNLLFLKDNAVTLNLNAPITCRYLVFLHTAVTRRDAPDEDGITRPPRGRIILGDKVADYQLIYEDGSEQSVAIRRRFAVGELRKDWGDECFEAVPLTKPIAIPTISERMSAGEPPGPFFGNSQTRVGSESSKVPVGYWVYALENQKPDQTITGIRFVPADGALLILGLTVTNLEENPLRWGRRQKALITLPKGVNIGRPDTSGRYPGLGIDLGQIISVAPKLDYDNANWKNGYNNKAPVRVENQFVVEYCAHPASRFTVASKDKLSFAVRDCQNNNSPTPFSKGDGGDAEIPSLKPINPAEQDVTIKVIEAKSGKKVAVKLHIHGEAGEYLPPADRHRIPNPYWFEDYSADYIANGSHFCTYIDGETRVKLPTHPPPTLSTHPCPSRGGERQCVHRSIQRI